MFLNLIWIQDQKPFGLMQWISLLSAINNTTYKILLHTNLLPDATNPYCPYQIQNPRFLINHREFNLTRYGVRLRPANLADIVRIELLYESGGMYADLDIGWLKDVDLTLTKKIVVCYQNAAYKSIANALIVAKEANWAPFKELLDQFDNRIKELASKGITDLRSNPEKGVSKNHLLLFKMTGDFFKDHPDDVSILGKVVYLANNWRRLGRHLRDAGVTLSPVVDMDCLGTAKNDRITFRGSSGVHFYSEMFSMEQLLKLPEIHQEFSKFIPALKGSN